MRQMSVAIVGIDHPNTDKSKSNRRFELLQCIPGEPVLLRPEPKNPHDEHAIAVYSVRGIQIGYLPSERAALIGVYLRHGRAAAAVFQELGPKVAICRIAFDGEAPMLPAARPAPAEEDLSGFWPDDLGGEWGA
jgi:hypothetical protein